ncbi:hypothetical protein FDP41_010656 [Naegleria fowleri]|uniref:Uncharacterized protein n=1 Tax=Naegleria fowleri TaxID=5763 RepID=A0A6A5C8V3_NAEFO|nr:uncharacterized protein FDP41_010656 [Naegleria fowleri]KAF0983591.1 hypothetical protein FDP41_010656 [Naegleria fowleri]
MDITTPEWTHLFVHHIFDFMTGSELLNQTCLVCSIFNHLVKMYISKQTIHVWKMESNARKFSLKKTDKLLEMILPLLDNDQIHSLQEYDTLSCIQYMPNIVFESMFYNILSSELNEDERRQVSRFMKHTVEAGPFLLSQDNSHKSSEIRGGYSLRMQYEDEEPVSYLLSEFTNHTKIHTLHIETNSPSFYHSFQKQKLFRKYEETILNQIFLYRSLILKANDDLDERICQAINPHAQHVTLTFNTYTMSKIASICNRFDSYNIKALLRIESNAQHRSTANTSQFLTLFDVILEFTSSKGFKIQNTSKLSSNSSSSHVLFRDEISCIKKLSILDSQPIDIIPTGLEELRLERIHFKDGSEFIQLLRGNCDSLETLHLCNIIIPYHSFFVLNGKPFSFPKLKHLIIDGCSMDGEETTLNTNDSDNNKPGVASWKRIFDLNQSSAQLQTLTFKRNIPELTHLPFSRICSLKQLVWEQLENVEDFKRLSQFPYLVDLQLIYNREFDQIALFHLGDKLKYLTRFIISGKINSPILAAKELQNALSSFSMKNATRFIHLDKQELFSKKDDERDYQFELSMNHMNMKADQKKMSQLNIISILIHLGSSLQHDNTQPYANLSPFSEYFKSIFFEGLFPCVIYSRFLSSGLKFKNFVVSNFDMVIEVLVPLLLYHPKLQWVTSSRTTTFASPSHQTFTDFSMKISSCQADLLSGGRDLDIHNNNGLVMLVLFVEKEQIIHVTCELNPNNLTPKRLKEIEQNWIKIYR